MTLADRRKQSTRYTKTAREAAATGGRRVAAGVSPATVVDYAAIAGKSDATMSQQTGRNWREWVTLLENEGAAGMTHGDIARLVHDKFGVGDWWSQTVTVGYERLTGRRERGQRLSGAYEVSKSKTFDVPIATLFDACADKKKRRRWLGTDVAVRTATAPKAMRLQWADGTIVAMWFTSKGDAKCVLALAHTKLPSKASMEKARKEWTARLEELARVIDGNKASSRPASARGKN